MDPLISTAGRPLRLLVAPSAASAQGNEWAALRGVPARLALAGELTALVAALHAQGRVHAAVTLDSAILTGEPPHVVLAPPPGEPPWNTPFFLPPEIADGSRTLPDEKTDIYQLALCIVRLLARGRGARQLRDPAPVAAVLGADGTAAVALALHRDRARRPSAQRLHELLRDRLAELTEAPQLDEVALHRPIELPGADAIITWRQRYGTSLRIFGVNGFEVAGLDPRAHPHGYTIRPPSTGPIFVEVSNPHGRAVRQAGFIAFYEPPRVALDEHLPQQLPRLAVPDLPFVPVPQSAVLPARPVPSTDEHPVPRLVAPPLAPLLAALRLPAPTAATQLFRQLSTDLQTEVRHTVRHSVRALRERLDAATRGHAAQREGPRS